MRERVDLKSPVRENRPPGSVRGAPGNRRPYRDITIEGMSCWSENHTMDALATPLRRCYDVLDIRESLIIGTL